MQDHKVWLLTGSPTGVADVSATVFLAGWDCSGGLSMGDHLRNVVTLPTYPAF